MGRDKYVDQKEYLLGDSAFSTSAVMVAALKKLLNPKYLSTTSIITPKVSRDRLCVQVHENIFHKNRSEFCF